ncbi:MAG: nitronate monooxygenase, partial [Actinomycetota bacterium]|nr:nitronate monooxygenase [Actinomycetota bacterium]
MTDRTPLESVVGISPFHEPAARLVAAVDAAGGFGVLDLGRGDRDVRDELELAVRWTAGSFGVRMGAGCAIRPAELPEQVDLVVVETPSDLAVGRRMLVEVTSLREARIAAAAGAYGVIARGHEAGGRVGELSSFVLLQQLVAELDLPIWVCGGIGPQTAAAALVGGAAGVVLDSQLALLPEADTHSAVAAAVAAMDGSETVIRDGYRVLNSRLLPTPQDHVTDLGARDPHTQWVPVGQDGFLAAEFAGRHTDVAGVVRAIRSAMGDTCGAGVARTLAPGSVLA